MNSLSIAPRLGEPFIVARHDSGFVIGFEYAEQSVEFDVPDGADRVVVKEWAEAVERKLRGALPRDPDGYKGWRALPQGWDFNAEEMYLEDEDRWSKRLCVIRCPVCKRDGRPLERSSTFYVGGGMRWVGLDYQEPYSDYRTQCGRCHAMFRFTIHTPQ